MFVPLFRDSKLTRAKLGPAISRAIARASVHKCRSSHPSHLPTRPLQQTRHMTRQARRKLEPAWRRLQPSPHTPAATSRAGVGWRLDGTAAGLGALAKAASAAARAASAVASSATARCAMSTCRCSSRFTSRSRASPPRPPPVVLLKLLPTGLSFRLISRIDGRSDGGQDSGVGRVSTIGGSPCDGTAKLAGSRKVILGFCSIDGTCIQPALCGPPPD